MTTVVCPGSFDPVTLGHLDVFRRAAVLFDEVVVCVVVNPNKSGTFSVEERTGLLREVTADLPGVRVDSFSGLLVDYCREVGARAVVKGLRAPTDYDYELPMAHMNRSITAAAGTSGEGTASATDAGGFVDTVFLPTTPGLSFVSSSLCREVTRLGGDVSHLLPDTVATALRERLAPR